MLRRLTQILGLLLCILGWGFVGCTLAMDHWRVAKMEVQGGSPVVIMAWYWSDLWKDCYEDSAALVNCVDFGVLWTVKSHILAVKGLLIIGLCLSLVGTVLTFFGLECTRIGGDQRSKDRTLITASAIHLVGCISDTAAYCLYINNVVSSFLHSKADPSKLRYEIGPPLYLGLVGIFLILLGCIVHCATACRVNHQNRHPTSPFICEKEEEKEVLRGQKQLCRSSETSNKSRNVFFNTMASVVTV
uniref:claudin-10-like isoform X2 n=1 Tax=Scatophagus argus TaxID=75038 RepID=UPI001ED85B4A|nr:claudin-10-like isoform X2 [Scatophagus argus]